MVYFYPFSSFLSFSPLLPPPHFLGLGICLLCVCAFVRSCVVDGVVVIFTDVRICQLGVDALFSNWYAMSGVLATKAAWRVARFLLKIPMASRDLLRLPLLTGKTKHTPERLTLDNSSV